MAALIEGTSILPITPLSCKSDVTSDKISNLCIRLPSYGTKKIIVNLLKFIQHS